MSKLRVARNGPNSWDVSTEDDEHFRVSGAMNDRPHCTTDDSDDCEHVKAVLQTLGE